MNTMKVISAAMSALTSGNYNELGELLQPHIPMLLQVTLASIAEEAGAAPEQATAVLLYEYTANGTTTTMADVYSRDALNRPGELIGTIDVADIAQKLDISALIKGLQ